jgi:prepilin-type processing-associated H-X9-DG protein
MHVRILPQIEQMALFDRVDFRARVHDTTNIPVLGTSLPVFHCPSDSADPDSSLQAGDLSPYHDLPCKVAFTNYVANLGTHYYYYGNPFQPQPPSLYHTGIWWEENGGVAFGEITDGLSNTLMLSERARGRYPADTLPYWGWWAQGFGGDTGFGTINPINSANKLTSVSSNGDLVRMFGTASSFHPGGANFCIADGSVRFLPETIDSWDLDDNDIAQMWTTNTVVDTPKVYQWLSTRNGGETAAGD